jgi:threonine dehydrogenase-like Zn-dependent dehydrogenase
MRATVMHKARDVRVENVPDAAIQKPTDAVIRITRACICGSDLWPYNDMQLDTEGGGRRIGHEAIGIVEEVGSDVHRIRRGQLVVMPFAYSDGSCMFCEEGLNTSCVHGGFFGAGSEPGAPRRRRCASRRQTARSILFRSAKTTR